MLSNNTFGKIGPNSLNMSIPSRKRSPSFCSNIETTTQQQQQQQQGVKLQETIKPTFNSNNNGDVNGLSTNNNVSGTSLNEV